jgi:hypothetical protein
MCDKKTLIEREGWDMREINGYKILVGKPEWKKLTN